MNVLSGVIGRPVKSEAFMDPTPGLSITLLPSLGYNPAYGAFIGVSAAIGGWLGDPKTTNVSSASFGASYSTTGQISVQLKSDFFSPGNSYDFKGDWRYLDTSQPTYGLGPMTLQPSYYPDYPMDFTLYRLFETIYRGVPGTPFFVGLGYHFNQYQAISDHRADAGEPTPFVAYSRGYPTTTTSSGISANVLYDSRDNTINATRGLFWNSSIRVHAKVLGSDHDWQMLWSDLRVYPNVPKRSRNTLALWSYFWMTFGEAPYLDLPSIGWDTYGRGGRGYIQGRIRGQNQIYNEAEYRLRLTRDGLWGAVAFANFTATTLPETGSFSDLDTGMGVGLRVKFNKRTATNLTVDYGWGEQGQHNVFFGMQEAF